MQIYHFTCKVCAFESKLPLGSLDLDQILTDVNADYADYHLFRCDKEMKFMHADIHCNDFEGKCIADGSKLGEIKCEMHAVRCPRCTRHLIPETSAPLADAADSASVQ